MRKAEIYTYREIKKIQHLMGFPEFVSMARIQKARNVVYMPVGEYLGNIILLEYKIKKQGEYLILEK